MKLSGLFILHSAIFVLFFYDSFCAPPSNGKRIKHQISVENVEYPATKIGDSFYETEQFSPWDPRGPQIEDLVQEFKYLQTHLTNSEEPTQLNQTILNQIKAVWQSLVDSNHVDYDTVLTLRKDMARILFNAQERLCESPDETFFNGQCLPIGSTENCPSSGNMQLVDGPDNNGFCDCLDTEGANSLRIIFSDQTAQCHSQNTRGPCNVGEWFVLKDIPRCEPIPNECPDDGRHVYGNIRVYFDSDPSLEAGCWEIGRICPDEKSVVQVQQDDSGNLDVYCSILFDGAFSPASSAPLSLVSYIPCRKGTRRSRNGDCLHSFFG